MHPLPNPTTLEEILRDELLGARLEKIADLISQNPESTTFWLGAGLTCRYGQKPTWTEFLQSILDEYEAEIGAADTEIVRLLIARGRYAMAAECIHNRLGKRIYSILHEQFSGPYKDHPSFLAPFCINKLVTTNYDTLIESCMPWYKELSPSDDLESLIEDDFKIIKIHGSVTKPKSCVLTLSNYARAYSVNLQWYLLNLFSNNSVIFVGSSLHYSELLLKTLSLNKKIRKQGLHHPHYAFLSVENDEKGTEAATRLSKHGIYIIPYIPDANHSLVDKIFERISGVVKGSEGIRKRIQIARNLIKQKKYEEASIYVNQLAMYKPENFLDQREYGDLFRYFFTKLLKERESRSIVEKCNLRGLQMERIILNSFDVMPPTNHAVGHVDKIIASYLEGNVHGLTIDVVGAIKEKLTIWKLQKPESFKMAKEVSDSPLREI